MGSGPKLGDKEEYKVRRTKARIIFMSLDRPDITDPHGQVLAKTSKVCPKTTDNLRCSATVIAHQIQWKDHISVSNGGAELKQLCEGDTRSVGNNLQRIYATSWE